MADGRNKYQLRENRAQVREVLMREWDPIGVRDVPEAQDEYDAYVGEVYVMLMEQRASTAAITAYLLDVVTRRMGIAWWPRITESSSRRTAETLVALRATFETH